MQLLETGTILELEQQYSPKPECEGAVDSSSLARVSLRSFSVLFAITGSVTIICYLVSLLFHLHEKRPLGRRMTDLKDRARSRIRDYIKGDDPSSLPTSTRIEETGSSNEHIMDIEVVPHHS